MENVGGKRYHMWKALRHFNTITRHRLLVLIHCCKAGIPFQGLVHDLSKYSPTEFIPGARYYQGTRSPNEREREVHGYSSAWLHHKGRNKHHFEYWTDYNIETHRLEAVKMPERYLAEMFCDRVAASKIYYGKNYTDGKPLEYFLKSKGKRMIHPKTSAQLEKLLVILEKEGEQAAFSYVRKKYGHPSKKH